MFLYYRFQKKPVRKQHVLNLNITKPNQLRYGKKSLRVLSPKIWNNLPSYLKSAPNLLSFKHLIKSRDDISYKCNLGKKLIRQQTNTLDNHIRETYAKCAICKFNLVS